MRLKQPAFARAPHWLNTRRVKVRLTQVRASAQFPTLASERGFTLVELMTVVVITGILATVAVASLRGYVTAARGSEALAMVQSIRAAEERWRSEHMMYLNVSTDDSWYPTDPRDADSPSAQRSFFGDGTHTDNTEWLLLHPTTPGPVRFGYLVNAGPGGGTMTTPALGPTITWPNPAPDNWYVIQAVGDVDGDGHVSYYRASSLSGEVFSQNHGE
jgi:prepilin-type N-terminal cleavage/methylation domain-containing protein